MAGLRIWAVSDGRAGVENQALGLAEAVARLIPAEITVKRIAYRGMIARLPTALNLAPRLSLSSRSDPMAPPWPDMVVAAGRASLPLSLRMRRWSQGRTFVVQTQDPRFAARRFDLVVPPAHDQVDGDNVIAITGAPNRLTEARLAAALARFPAIAALEGRKVAVLIGGRSKTYDLSPAGADRLARLLDTAIGDAAVLMTFSRRTPPIVRQALSARLSGRPGLVWDGEGDNPYEAILAAADQIAVTEDSINMAAEAAFTGKPVHLLKMEGASARLARFHQDLIDRGAARWFDGRFDAWPYTPLRETDRAAAEIVRRLRARTGRAPPE